MRKTRQHNHLTPAIESLECRRLLATTPWGAYPQLIDQDLAVSSYAQYNGSGQTIAFIDTGVEYTHPAVSGKYLGGYDFVSDDSDPRDTDGHGTGLATIALGNSYTFNGAKYQGIAPGAKVIALRVDDGGNISDEVYEDAFQWIISHRQQYNITVVNCSFGAGHYTTEAARAVYADEMAQLAAAGVVIIASSGNDGAQTPYGIEYPGADPSVFSVGSVNASDVISKFTERGPILDILAPGENVPTAYLNGNGATYLTASGTSFSAPFIAGAAAILKQIDPTFTPNDVMSILRASASDNGDWDKEASPLTGLTYPRLDLDNAIYLALQRRSGQSPAIGVNGRDNAVRFDRDGVLYFVWLDDNDHRLKMATQSNNGAWSAVQTIDTGSSLGFFYVSLALTSTGKPAVAYYDSQNADLKFAQWTGRSWSVSRVDSNRSTGYYPSLAFDAYDDSIITYYYKTAGDLRIAYDDGTGWSIATIDSAGDVGRFSSFAFSNTGQWSVAYENDTTGEFKFAKKGKSWVIQSVDDTQTGGGFVSLAYDNNNQPAFSYYDGFNSDLKFAQFNGSVWSTETVASQFSQGLYTNLLFDGSGDADIVYYHKSLDAVFRASGSSGNWSVGQLVGGGGRLASASRYGSYHVYTYFDAAANDLLVGSY